MIRKASAKDKLAIYNLYNTQTKLSNKYIDLFFNKLFNPNEYHILIMDNIVLALVRIKDEIIHFNNINVETNVICDYLVADNCDSKLLDEFLNYILTNFKYDKVFTLSNYNVLNKLDVFSYQKKYKLYRSDLFFVNDYFISEDYSPEDLFMLYKQFSKHFENYLFRSVEYFEELLITLKALNYEIYVTKSKSGQLLGYIIYNYIDGEIEVVEIVYLDSVALITLLNKAMGINNYIFVYTSKSESLGKIFKNIEYVISENMYIQVNDIELFGRLFNVSNFEISAFLSTKATKFLRY